MQALFSERRILSKEASTSGFMHLESAWHMPHPCTVCSRQVPLQRKSMRRLLLSTNGRRQRRFPTTALYDEDRPPEYLEQEYFPDANAEYWSLRPVTVFQRSLQIGLAFAGWFIETRLRPDRVSPTAISGSQAEKLRKILISLGPAFVKIGQAVSSRPDFVPPDYTRELEKLQDKIPPFPDAAAMQIIQEELGRPASQVFSEMSPTSVAAASLGQVYKARVRSTGRVVAVKVQRPGVREAIALDIYIMRFLAGRFGAWRKVNSDLPSLLDEWAGSLFRELDYCREARNGTKFRELYSHLQGVYIPEMLHELTTQRVLTMEWLSGVRLRSAGEDPSVGRALSPEDMKLVGFGVQCSLEQMLEDGFYHADPHPGNLLRTDAGRLGYLDFGMMASIEPKIRRGLIRATLHMVNREFQALANDFETLGLLPAGSDKDQVVPALSGVFEKALAGGVSNMSFSSLSGELGKTMYEFQFRIPPYYTLLVRSLSVLEGIALSSDPNYKVLGAAYPWIARRLLTDSNPELRETLRVLLYKGNRFQFSRLESLLRQALKSPARAYRGDIPATQAASAPQQTGGKALDLLLGDEGSYVRELVTDELAKGVDAAWRLSTDDVLQDARMALTALVQGNSSWGRLLPSSRREQHSLSLSLLATLNSFPALADEADTFQVEGIMSLVRLLREINNGSSTRQSLRFTGPAAILPAQVSEAATILQWFVEEARTLSPSARAEAIRLPLTLGVKLSSRIAARALKAVLSNGNGSTNNPASSREPPATVYARSSSSQPPTRLVNGKLQPAGQPPAQPVVGLSPASSTVSALSRPGADTAVSIPPGASSTAGLSSQGGGPVSPARRSPSTRYKPLKNSSSSSTDSSSKAASNRARGSAGSVNRALVMADGDEARLDRSGIVRRVNGDGKSAEIAMRGFGVSSQ